MSKESMYAWRKKNPEKDAYNNLKNNSKRRGVYFDLTFEQFKTFLYRSDYMELRGRGANNLTIDRIRASGGYTMDNIAILTKRENSIKRHIEYPKTEKRDDCPF